MAAAAAVDSNLEDGGKAAVRNRDRLDGVYTLMHRVGTVLSVVFVVVSAAIYLGTRDSTTSAFGLTLTAQRSPAIAGAKWTTTRRLSLTCGTVSATNSPSPSGRALCNAVAYYSHHVPHRCVAHGVIVKYTRVVIRGSLDGHRLHLALAMDHVCDPPPALARAVRTISVAAFN